MNLYHFTKQETAINKIIPQKQLRMNNLCYMNDPKENLNHIVNFENIIYKQNKGVINIDDCFIAERIGKETQIISFATDKEIETQGIKKKIRGFQFQRMWATYGQNHEGICLVIDNDRFQMENKELIEKYQIKGGMVSYTYCQNNYIPAPKIRVSSKNSNMLITTCSSDHWKELQIDEEFVKDRFFTKNADWEGESEYRYLAFDNQSNEIFLSIKNSLTMVIVGINFSPYYLPSLLELIPKEKIQFIEPNDSTGEFQKMPLR